VSFGEAGGRVRFGEAGGRVSFGEELVGSGLGLNNWAERLHPHCTVCHKTAPLPQPTALPGRTMGELYKSCCHEEFWCSIT